MLEIIEVIGEKETPIADKVSFLQLATGIQFLKTLSSETLNKVVLKVKLNLEAEQAQPGGLMLLQSLMVQCADKVFTENNVYWMRSILRILQVNNCYEIKQIACGVLKTMLICCTNYPTVVKEISEKVVPEIVAYILETSPENKWGLDVMGLLATCLKHMPGSCFVHKEGIAKFLSPYLNTVSNQMSDYVSECYCYLPQVMNNYSNTARQKVLYSGQWTEHMSSMMGTFRKVVDNLYGEVMSEDDPPIFPTSIDLPSESEDTLTAAMSNARCLQTVSKIICKTLRTETRASVQLPISHFLIIVGKALSITPQDLPIPGTCPKPLLSFILPTVYSSALTIMESLIMAVPDHLCYQETEIMDSLIRCLKAQDMLLAKENIQCSVLRATTYRVIRLWIENLHPTSLKNYLRELCSELLKDINPLECATPRSELSTVEDHSTKDGSNLTARAFVCSEALMLLSTLMYAVNEISNEMYQFFESVQIAARDILCHLQCADNVPLPYTDKKCRLQLYTLFLHVAIQSQYAGSPQALCVSGPIFERGKTDSYAEIGHFCYLASSICLLMMRPERVVVTRNVRTAVDPHPIPTITTHDMAVAIASVQHTNASSWETAGTNTIISPAPNHVSDVCSSSPDSSSKKPELKPTSSSQRKNIQQNKEAEVYDVEDDCDDDDEDEEEDMDEEDFDESNQYEDEDEEMHDASRYEEDEEEMHEASRYEDEEDLPEEEDEEIELDMPTYGLEGGDGSQFDRPESKSVPEDSSVNGLATESVNENGFDSSAGGSPNLTPVVPRKRRRTNATEEATEPAPSTSKPASAEAPEPPATDEGPSEISVESMIQDFVPCPPETSKS